jgi:hypothetical protein
MENNNILFDIEGREFLQGITDELGNVVFENCPYDLYCVVAKNKNKSF